MASKLLIKRSALPGKAPTELELDLGELAINTTDGKLFLKKRAGTIESIVEVGQVPPAPTGMNYFHAIATSGQVDFNFPWSYTQGAHSLLVFIQGVKQEEGIAYSEFSPNSIRFSSPLLAGDEVEVTQIGGNVTYPALQIANENLGLTSSPSSINFVGDGVNATNVGNAVTVEITTSLIRQNVQSAGYTCVLTDAGKHIYFNSVGNFAIPSNALVAFPVGTVITFVNFAGASTISCGDTMYLAGTLLEGTRTLATRGMATALKLGTTSWIISGTGLT